MTVTSIEARRAMAKLADRYLLEATPDHRTQVVNLMAMLRHALAYADAVTREMEHYAAEANEARDQRDEAIVARDEMRAVLEEVRDDLAAMRDQLTEPHT